MAGNARQTPGSRPKTSVYFEDPKRPGKSRHLKCFRNAGIDPQRSGFQQTDGPCWVCGRSGGEPILYNVQSDIALEREELATALTALARGGLSLSNAVRLTHWTGIITKTALEASHGPKLRRFRRDWKKARQLSAQTVLEPSPAATEQHSETADTVQNLLLRVARWLRVDPTDLDELDVTFIESISGWFAMAARALHEDASEILTTLRDNKGKDGTEALMNVAAALSAHQITVAHVVVSLQPELTVAAKKNKAAHGQDARDVAAQRLVHSWDERRSQQRRKSKKPQRPK